MQSLFERLALRPERVIVLFSLALLLAGNWILPLTDRDEVRFAEASREMMQRGDYVVPWFNGAWRLDKPPLIYWCQIASYKILGVNGFAARLPSALFTTGTALLLVRWGRRITGAKAGLLAGLIFVAGLHVAMIGRMATADMALVFFFTLAVWSGWEWTCLEPGPRVLWWWIFCLALALGFLAKGPEIWLPLVGLILGRSFRGQNFRLPVLATVAGFILSIALMAWWGVPALNETHGQFLNVGIGEHVLHRSVGVINNHGFAGLLGFVALLPLYFVTFFVSFFPWSLRMPSALIRWWPERRTDTIGWYLLTQAAVVFVVFSLVRTKLPHYTIPAFPCLALWLALQVAAEKNSGAWVTKRAAGMAVFIALFMFGFFSFAKNYFLTENLWRAVQPHIRPETKVGCFGFTESSLVWRLRGSTTNDIVLGPEKGAADFLTNPPPFILVLPTSDVAGLPETNGTSIRVHGLDIVKLKNWDLTAIVRP